MIREQSCKTYSGYPALGVLIAAQLVFGYLLVMAIVAADAGSIVMHSAITTAIFILWFGLFMVEPNEGKVLLLFGEYKGTERSNGLRWSNPFYTKQVVSLRIRNFESDKLKVNDLHGSPIEIAAVVVWRVVDTAEAVFQVDDYENFVHIQSEAALRGLATRFSYDFNEDEDASGTISLRAHTGEVARHLQEEIQDRLTDAGVEVLEARISHLAYAPEIASAMLQRQQADAIIAARRKIVDGAVGMVELALDRLSNDEVIEFDDERKAAMVSNLMVVLCGDRSPQPIVNTGSLY